MLFAAAKIAEPFLLWDAWLPAGLFQPVVALVEAVGAPLAIGGIDDPEVWVRTANNLLSLVLMLVVVAFYSATGGLRGVVATDIGQIVVMGLGTAAFTAFVVVEAGGTAAPPGAGDLPATNVSWLDAVRFCNRLSRREGLAPFYRLEGGDYRGIDRQADGYRLPTEAEWEWLARKAGRGTRTRFSWGNEEDVPPASGNLADESARGRVDVYIPKYTDGFPELAPVGRFNPDKAGVYDLSGNVSEWTHDAYSPTPARTGEEIDPVGDERGAARVVKGSNWRSATLAELRAAFRESAVGGRDDLGFRVARYLYGEEDAKNR